jgi:hypothetical protein
MTRSDYATFRKAKIWRERAVNYVLINKSRDLLWRAFACLKIAIWRRSLAERYVCIIIITTIATTTTIVIIIIMIYPSTLYPRSASASFSRHVTSLLRQILSFWRQITVTAHRTSKFTATRRATVLRSSVKHWRLYLLSRSLIAELNTKITTLNPQSRDFLS